MDKTQFALDTTKLTEEQIKGLPAFLESKGEEVYRHKPEQIKIVK